MNLLVKFSSIALSVLFTLVVCASEQPPTYKIGDCMNISGFKTVAYLHRALVYDNELAERCLEKEISTQETTPKLVPKDLRKKYEAKKRLQPQEQLKNDFACGSKKLDDDYLRIIDQELAYLEEQANKKREALAQSSAHLLSQYEPDDYAPVHHGQQTHLVERKACWPQSVTVWFNQ